MTLIAHPLMAVTLWMPFAMRFHNWTSLRAWPRVPAEQKKFEPFAMRSEMFGSITCLPLGGDVYSFHHPNVSHTFETNAGDVLEAHFSVLSNEFGGAFNPR